MSRPGASRVAAGAAVGLTAGFAALRLARGARRPGHPFLAGAPLLIAHRGGSRLAPENTLVAFRRAVEWWGADMIELDVQPTADGEAVVFHDPTLERTTDGAGPLSALDLAAVKRLDAGFRFSSDGGRTFPFRGQGVRVSTFAEILEALPGLRLIVEIKDARAQGAVASSIAAAGAESRVLVAAGERENRALFDGYAGPLGASAEEIRAFYKLHRARLSTFARLTIDALQVPEMHEGRRIVTPRLVRDAHAHNLPVHVWTVDEEEDMRRLLDWGVDGILTDRPDRLGRVLHERDGRPLPPGPPGSQDSSE